MIRVSRLLVASGGYWGALPDCRLRPGGDIYSIYYIYPRPRRPRGKTAACLRQRQHRNLRSPSSRSSPPRGWWCSRPATVAPVRLGSGQGDAVPLCRHAQGIEQPTLAAQTAVRVEGFVGATTRSARRSCGSLAGMVSWKIFPCPA